MSVKVYRTIVETRLGPQGKAVRGVVNKLRYGVEWENGQQWFDSRQEAEEYAQAVADYEKGQEMVLIAEYPRAERNDPK